MSSRLSRMWGSSEYHFATKALREGRNTRPFMWFIGVCCLFTAVLGVFGQFHPDGPQGVVARSIQAVVVLTAVVVGVAWLVGRWPTHPWAVAYVIWADCALAAVSLTMSTPVAQLCTT